MNTQLMRLMRLHRLMSAAGEDGAAAGGGAGESAAGEAGAPAVTESGEATTLLTAEASPDDATADGGEGAKPEGEEQKAAEGEAEKKPEEGGAPAAYADFTMPDGVEMHGEVAEEFKAVAKELNLSQSQAQKLADLGVKQAQAGATRQAELLKQANAEWTAATQADKEFGGQNLSANLAVARKAMDQFGSPELKTLLNESGLGNHPEVIRLFYRTGKAISEDGFVGGRGTNKPKSDTEVFYGTSSTTAQ